MVQSFQSFHDETVQLRTSHELRAGQQELCKAEAGSPLVPAGARLEQVAAEPQRYRAEHTLFADGYA